MPSDANGSIGMSSRRCGPARANIGRRSSNSSSGVHCAHRPWPSAHKSPLQWEQLPVEICHSRNALALLTSVKRQVFSVRDRLKMIKQKAWATTLLRLDRVNDHERTDEANFHGKFNSVSGHREQPKQSPEHTIVSSILKDLIPLSAPNIESARQPSSSEIQS